MKREHVVAGAFYPKDRNRLSSMIDGFLSAAVVDEKAAKKAISYVAPHAGYIYSGAVAAYTYKALSMRNDISRKTFVVIGPNHTGHGTPLSISRADWTTPLGSVLNDYELTIGIVAESKFISLDAAAHAYEHSVEVQLPFLQRLFGNVKCCFICMGDQSYNSSEILCDAIWKAAKKLKREIVIIASSDFNHYESEEVAKSKDLPAIEVLESLDAKKFNKLLEDSGDSACGYGPITVSALYAKKGGGKAGTLLKYATSGDVTMDYSSVVAYASIIFSK